MDNNNVQLIGKVTSGFEYSHTSYDEDFYMTTLGIRRKSGYIDEIILIISENFIDYYGDLTNCYVGVSGNIRTYNDKTDVKTKLKTFVFVDRLDVLDISDDDGDVEGENIVSLTGYICKKSPLRQTPLGRTITDMVLAVNRPYSKSDYPVCVTWGRNASLVDNLPIGTEVNIEGRFQSRDYIKNDINNKVYEISISSIKRIDR